MHLSYLGPASCFLIFHNLSSLLIVACGSSQQLLYCSLFSLLGALWAQKFTFGGPKLLMTMTFLFTDMAGNTTFHSPSLWLKIRPIFGGHFMTIFVPRCWKAHLRSGGISHQYVTSDINSGSGPLTESKMFSGSSIF